MTLVSNDGKQKEDEISKLEKKLTSFQENEKLLQVNNNNNNNNNKKSNTKFYYDNKKINKLIKSNHLKVIFK